MASLKQKIMKNAKELGRHIILELYDCPELVLNDLPLLESNLRGAAEAMGASVVTSSFHQFSPYGDSGVVIIQESHLTIHTWPEYRYAAIDIFTCGEIDMERGVQYLVNALEAQRSEWQLLKRGLGLVRAEGARSGF